MTYLDYETVVSDASQIIKGRENYIYVDPKGNSADPNTPTPGADCVYFDPKTNVPSCIVGEVFARHGVTYEDVKDSNGDYVRSAAVEAGIKLETPALTFLEQLQNYQDTGSTWRSAFEKALNFENGGF